MIATTHDNPVPTMTARTARWLTVGFALLIVSVPLSEVVLEAQAGTGLTCLDIFRHAPTLANIQAYEQALDRNLRVAKAVRPWTQYGSTRLLERGNEKVVVARYRAGGAPALLYRPSYAHLVGPAVSTKDVDGQPYHAIVAYHRALAERGIKLVVLPVPGKEEYEVPELVPSGEECRNEGTRELFDQLRAAGVLVDDPFALFAATWQSSTSRYGYLPLDTHWRPGLMDLAAEALGHSIRAEGWLDGPPERPYRAAPEQSIENHGDLFDMLELPPSQDLYEPWREDIEPILEPDGSPWQPDPNGPILLLGDSFANIYSDPSLQWGSGAGLAEHLAYHARAGVDVIALNDGGVNGCRQALARQPQRLEGKRVVIWQFATRDLSNKAGEWRTIPLPPPIERERSEP